MHFKRVNRRVRPSVVAGSFYPRSAEELGLAIADLSAAAPRPSLCGIRGIIAPHAGYVYSGSVAAAAFASILNLKDHIHRAVVVGPAHFVRFGGIAAPSYTAFATPLGEVPVDTMAVEELVDAGLVIIDDVPHAQDHALEVELPFLQAIFGELPIVPLLFGRTGASEVAAAIARVWNDETMLVVSSDLSHYEEYETAQRHDTRTAAAIETFHESAIGPGDACGHLAVRGALIEAKRQGLEIHRLDLRNSGDTAGDKQSVVGYGAWAFHRSV